MSAILRIATNTLRQTIRQRLYFNIAVFGVFMLILSMVMARITFGDSARVVRSIGLSGTAIAIDLMALLVGVSLVHQEIDKKTLFVILTRPIRRWQYLVGRYLGLMAAVFTALIGFTLIFVVTVTVSKGSPVQTDFVALFAIMAEAAVIAAFGILMSSFSTPTLSAGIGLGFWLACTTTDDLVRLTVKAEPATHQLAKIISYLLPSLERFNFREAAVYKVPIETGDFLWSMVYGGMWAVVLLAIASVVLSRREMV